MASGTIENRRSKLLWVNSAASSADFSAQTVMLDLSAYQFIHVSYLLETGNSAHMDATIPVDELTHTIANVTNYSSGTASIVSRTATPSDTGIVFSAGMSKTLPNGTRTTANSAVIPRYIYGIK